MADQQPGAPGLEALQAAALQLIAAARTFLDAAEHVVSDPDAMHQVVSSVGAVAKGVVEAVVPAVRNAATPRPAPVEVIDLGDEPGTSDR